MIRFLVYTVVLLGTALYVNADDDDGEGRPNAERYHDYCETEDAVRLLSECSNDEFSSPRSTGDLTKIGNNYYLLSSRKLSWGNAFKYCMKQRLRLISFEKQQEITAVVDYLQKNGHADNGLEADIFWTSGTNLGLIPAVQYYWTATGQTVEANEISWWPGFPNAVQGVAFNYLVKGLPQHKYTLLNRVPTLEFKFMCEKY